MSPRLRNLVTVVVCVGWLLNLVAGAVPALGYKSSLEANAPMMLVLGSLYGTKKRKDDDES